jgi:hypothetical protein
MIIEIHAPKLKIDENVITRIKKSLVGISHLGEKISRAEVYLSEGQGKVQDNKTCKITLSLTGDSFFVTQHAGSFEKAALSAIKLLKKGLKKNIGKRNEPPEEIITTVNTETSIPGESS